MNGTAKGTEKHINRTATGNKAIRRAVSILGIGYLAIVYILAFFSLFYDIVIEKKALFFLIITGVCLFFGTIMIYTRKEPLTRIISMLSMPAILPIILFYFGQWLLIVPIVILTIFMFFACGATEKTKTIFGTVFLLFYIFGALGFFVYTALFIPDHKEIIIRSGIVSQAETYKCYVTDAAANSTLGTRVYVEPNTYDIKSNIIRFEAKGYKTRVYCDNSLNRKSGQNLQIEWRVESRGDIINYLLILDPYLRFYPSDRQRKLLETGDAVEFIPDDDENEFLYLSSLTAEHFEILGIPEEGDVLYVEGKARFRFVTAMLDDSFDIANRKILF